MSRQVAVRERIARVPRAFQPWRLVRAQLHEQHAPRHEQRLGRRAQPAQPVIGIPRGCEERLAGFVRRDVGLRAVRCPAIRGVGPRRAGC